MQFGEFKHIYKTVKLKDDKMYVLVNIVKSFQDKLLKNVFDSKKKDYKHDIKVLSLTN